MLTSVLKDNIMTLIILDREIMALTRDDDGKVAQRSARSTMQISRERNTSPDEEQGQSAADEYQQHSADYVDFRFTSAAFTPKYGGAQDVTDRRTERTSIEGILV